MPIYSVLTFIRWDKTRYSMEINKPFLSQRSEKCIIDDIRESYNRPHRKNDLEGTILNMSLSKEYCEAFDELVEHFRHDAKTFEEKVAVGRMDKKQYDVISNENNTITIQGKPYDDIKEEAIIRSEYANQITKLIETGNVAREKYDSDAGQSYEEWLAAYNLRGYGKMDFAPDCVVASCGVKHLWNVLKNYERDWCVQVVMKDVEDFCRSGAYTVEISFTSDALLYILLYHPDDAAIRKDVFQIINLIGENDALFERFEKTFIKLIWKRLPDLAYRIIVTYFMQPDVKVNSLQGFSQICKLLPLQGLPDDVDKLIAPVVVEYVNQWVDKKNRYSYHSDFRFESFLAAYMLESPGSRVNLIKGAWLDSALDIKCGIDDDNPISNVFAHCSYLVNKDNCDKFWELWEIIFEWYKLRQSTIVLPALLLRFEFLDPNVPDDLIIMNGSKSHIVKVLRELKSDELNLIPRLLCKMGFKELLPYCLRYIDIEILKESSRNSKNFVTWQNAVEDLYDDPTFRDVIRNDRALRSAFVEIMNGLIYNGSAISYIIRDYYI
jgi:hypothetical protein